MLADISHGHAALADWLFLIGAVLALLAAIAYSPKTVTPKLSAWGPTLATLGLCAVAFGFLVL